MLWEIVLTVAKVLHIVVVALTTVVTGILGVCITYYLMHTTTNAEELLPKGSQSRNTGAEK